MISTTVDTGNHYVQPTIKSNPGKVYQPRENPLDEGAEVPRVFEKPPECNIGTAGHVDHGKCLALEEFIITNRGVLTGKDLRKLVQEVECRTSFNGGLLYDLRDLTVITFSEDMRLKPSNAAIYLQPYKGVMIKVRTKKGRTVTVTPNHPLMVFRGNEAKWVSAHSLKVGDRLAIIRKLRAPEVPFKPFNDLALRELKKNYICLTRRDYLELKLKTGCFRKFSSCDLEDFKKLLILHNLS
ncbi:TPA: hypothetical protein EYP27_00055, partial [Candidatus Bathyarchaeota archaeon]|nr:hypothetical protein [Candidatus Bathyarchaeota archaeon]